MNYLFKKLFITQLKIKKKQEFKILFWLKCYTFYEFFFTANGKNILKYELNELKKYIRKK